MLSLSPAHRFTLLSSLFALSSACAPSSSVLAPDAACPGSIESVQARIPAAMAGQQCPARWEDVPAVSPCPAPYGLAPRAGSCDGFLLYEGACSLDQFACVYDSTTHALIGAAESTDTPAYCDRSASCMAAGTLPTEVHCVRDGLSLVRPTDAGTTTCNLTPLPVTTADTDAGAGDS